MSEKKLKAEKREVKKTKRKKVSLTSATLAGQSSRLQSSRNYKGDSKKI